ncbi:polyketide synthase protein [Colletotrichum tabaci]|uniref:Polyketide synthase protein n=1 Tax=Colletotrichum tabaci TaxID=1209068 RepID=A0AAV9T8W3_9PEZI
MTLVNPPRIALFGPQKAHWTPQALAALQTTLQSDARLAFLREALEMLPSLWPLIESILDTADTGYPGAQKLQHLHDLATGVSSMTTRTTTTNPLDFSNTELAPLTVVSQVVDWIQRHGDENSYNLGLDTCDAAQGFCLGFLSAAAVSVATDAVNFRQHVSNAIRLAACIGAVIDVEDKAHAASDAAVAVSVRCKTPQDRAHLDSCLEALPRAYVSCITDDKTLTVTLPQGSQDTLSSLLKEAGVTVVPVGIRGRYHNQEHSRTAERLARVCAEHGDLQLPGAEKLRLPLRSTATSEVIETGSLHDIAIQLILCRRAHWFQTVKKTIGDREYHQLSSYGTEPCVPPSLARKSKSNGTASGGGAGASSDKDDEIAVVGMACRFPRSENLEAFWQLLADGQTALGTMPADRFDPATLTREPRLANFYGNFIDAPDAFDHRFFGISGREAKSMDPQQRLALQVAYEALESAGYGGGAGTDGDGTKSTGPNVGCYLGVGSVDYDANVAARDANAFAATGTLRAFISGRVSHFFGWDGPSLTMDTACSSSAVAIHTARRALLAGECSMALAGGVNVITSPALHQNLAAGSFLNTRGSSGAFDDGASGYCRGEGAGILVLKPLSRAVADGDRVLGVLAGSAVNQNSNRSPITVPDSSSQGSLYRRVLDEAGIQPHEVTYVEAHGTGTKVGDPIEYESVRSTFSGPLRTGPVYLGSVKDNIGHAEAASGVAGVIKTLLMMQHQAIPKQANFSRLNRTIKVLPGDSDDVVVPESTLAWTTTTTTERRAALVNNYGAAGSNAAILVRQHTPAPSTRQSISSPVSSSTAYPIALSAKSETSLRSYMDVLKSFLLDRDEYGNPRRPLASVAYHIARAHNPAFDRRVAFVAHDAQDAAAALHTTSPAVVAAKRPVVLCFGGQTGRTVSVSKALYDDSDLFKSHLDKCEAICRTLGVSIYPAIFQNQPVDDTVTLHCMLLSLQISCAQSWIDSGLQVDTLIGHSFGQLTALCIAGSLDLHDTFRLVAGRARLLRDSSAILQDRGAMLAVECDADDLDDIVTGVRTTAAGYRVDVACYNGPRNFVLAGDAASIAAATDLCRRHSRLKTTKLQNDHAYHSYLTDVILPDLRELAASVTVRPPRIRVETCTVDARWPSSFGPDEIVEHTRQPVYFDQAVARIADRLPSAVWLEAGSATPIIPMARRVLSSTTTQNKPRSADVFIPVQLGTTVDAAAQLAKATCDLWTAGSAAQYWLFHPSSGHRYQEDFNVPPYQFEKSSHWLPFEAAAAAPVATGAKPEIVSTMSLESDPESEPETHFPPGFVTRVHPGDAAVPGQHLFVVDTQGPLFQLAARGHAVTGQSICPASMFVEMVARATMLVPKKPSTRRGGGQVPSLSDLTMSAPLGIGNSQTTVIRLRETGPDAWAFAIISQASATDPRGATQHASGTFSWTRADDTSAAKRLQLLGRLGSSQLKTATSLATSTATISGAMVYKWFAEVVDYADYYRGVQSVSADDGNRAVGRVTMPARRPTPLADAGVCDPITLDNFLQVAGIHCNCLSDRDKAAVLMCTSVDEIVFSPTFLAADKRSDDDEWVVYTRFDDDPKQPKTRTNDIFVCEAASGDIVVAVLGATFHSVPFRSLAKSLGRLNAVVPVSVPVLQSTKPVMPDLDDAAADSGYSSTDLVSQASDVDKTETHVDAFLSAAGDDHITASASATASTATFVDTLVKVRTLLSDMIEIPVDEVTPVTTLEELGIDSLLVTEVLAEIQKQFGVQLSQEQFAGCVHVRDVATLLQPAAAADVDSDAEEAHVMTKTAAVQPSVSPSSSSTVAYSHPKQGPGLPNLASIGHEAFTRCLSSYDTHADAAAYTDFYSRVFPIQSELVVQYVLTAFAQLGCDLARLGPGDILPAVDHQQKHSKVVTQLHQILVDAGLVTKDGLPDAGKGAGSTTYRRTAAPLPTAPATALMERLLRQFPQHASETKLLYSTGSRLAECLTGRAEPVSLIFQDAAARALLADVYTNAPMFKTGTLQLAEYLSSIVSALAGTGRRPLRILELGAGTGGTTKSVIEKLTAIAPAGGAAANFTYTFTDLSPSLVAAARRRFAQWSSFMEYKVVDVEKDPAPEFLGAYDVILSTNCIHATRDLVASTRNIRRMLRPDGLLCLVELTRNLYWFDLVFGLLEGWWLFEDGRQHALAGEERWEQALQKAGFAWVDWSRSSTRESETLRVITASAHNPLPAPAPAPAPGLVHNPSTTQQGVQTILFKDVDGVQLHADIYYPEAAVASGRKLPVALMIHGGGHIMLSRNDIRPRQTEMLLKSGFLPVSVDYRLCPEVTLAEGPMTDVADALSWVRNALPSLLRPGFAIDTDKVVAVGWSTGGHLAMTLAWTSLARQVAPPTAILAFYSPLDYEDDFWMRPNVPRGATSDPAERFPLDARIWDGGVFDTARVEYRVAPTKRALGGWMAASDPRSRLALHMNAQGRTLHVLLNGLDKTTRQPPAAPTSAEIAAVSPLARVRAGHYATPTFIIHPREDDLIPWQQADRTWRALRDRGVDAELRLVEGVPHLFDLARTMNDAAERAVVEGYEFLCQYVGVSLRL